MKLIYKKVLFVLLGIIVYLGGIFLGAAIFVNFYEATVFWTKIFEPIVVFSSCMTGSWFVIYGINLSEPPTFEYDLKLLVHAVVNQYEADFNDQTFEAMDEMLNRLIKGEECNTTILYQYLSDSAQENLKEGLTVKRWR